MCIYTVYILLSTLFKSNTKDRNCVLFKMCAFFNCPVILNVFCFAFFVFEFKNEKIYVVFFFIFFFLFLKRNFKYQENTLTTNQLTNPFTLLAVKHWRKEVLYNTTNKDEIQSELKFDYLFRRWRWNCRCSLHLAILADEYKDKSTLRCFLHGEMIKKKPVCLCWHVCRSDTKKDTWHIEQ